MTDERKALLLTGLICAVMIAGVLAAALTVGLRPMVLLP